MVVRTSSSAAVSLSMALLLATAAAARADPFYLRYDADEVYPEDAGWERHSTDPYGVVVRTLEDGLLRIDSSATVYATDWYLHELSGLPLAPGERMDVEWRMHVLTSHTDDGLSDVGVTITNGDAAFVVLSVATDFVAVNEDGLSGPEHLYEFEPGWHTFHVTTWDMQHYSLVVDDDAAFAGEFTRHAVMGPNRIAFGDTVIGLSSISEWDYVEVAIVPEPASGALAGVAGAWLLKLLRRAS